MKKTIWKRFYLKPAGILTMSMTITSSRSKLGMQIEMQPKKVINSNLFLFLYVIYVP